VERLEHHLRQLLAVRLRVQRRLGGEHGVVVGRQAQLVVEALVEELLHRRPVRHAAALDRVVEREDAALRQRLVAHEDVLLAHAHHDALVARPARHAGEDGVGRVLAGEARLEVAAAEVDHDGAARVLRSVVH